MWQIMKQLTKIMMIFVFLAFTFGCVGNDETTNPTETLKQIDNDAVKDDTSLSNTKDNVENPTTSAAKADETVIEDFLKVEMSTKDFFKTNGYEADVKINKRIMNVYFDTTKLTKTDTRHMVDNCLNNMKNYLPNQDVQILFYDSEDQKIAFGSYSNSYDRTTISFYDYDKYPDIDETTEELLKSFGYDTDVQTDQRGMLIYFHTKGVSYSNLYSVSEMCVDIMMKSLPDQKSRVVIYDDNDQLIAAGDYIEWLDENDIMVY